MIKRKFTTPFKPGLSAFMKIIAGFGLISFPATNGSDQKISISYDGLERTFHIHVPTSDNKSEQLPLVIVLHGRGGNGESMVLITRKGFDFLSESDRFIVAYPDGIELNWNDGRIDEEANDRAHSENIDDVGFISALIDYMIRNYYIDSKRVYVTGISNGAIMSYRLACELSHKITAIAPVDGSIPYMLFPECSPSNPVSVLAINNINDPLVPFEGGEIYGHFRRVKLGKVLSVNETIGFWVNRNKCISMPYITEEPDNAPKDGTRVTRKEYSNGIDGTEVILYSVEGGGHTWPGGFQYLPAWIIGKTSRDINANEVIWSFFRKHSR
jgi:polyhydroxybutyrate depolymerase